MKIFPAVASSWSRRGECSEGKSWELRGPQLWGRGSGWTGRLSGAMHFYRSKCEHHRCPKVQGCQTEGLEEGVGTKGGLWGGGGGGGLGNSQLYSTLSSFVSVVILRRFSLTLINSGARSSSFSGGFSS